jgi:hypothetical protein
MKNKSLSLKGSISLQIESVSVLRWMGQDEPTQLGPEDGDRSSLRNVVGFFLPSTLQIEVYYEAIHTPGV